MQKVLKNVEKHQGDGKKQVQFANIFPNRLESPPEIKKEKRQKNDFVEVRTPTILKNNVFESVGFHKEVGI